MADNIVNLQFNNDPLYANGSTTSTVNYSGSLQVDFTTNSVVGGSGLAFSNGTTVPASDFVVINPAFPSSPNTYELHAGTVTTTTSGTSTTYSFPNGFTSLYFSGTSPASVAAVAGTANSSFTVDASTGNVSNISSNVSTSEPGTVTNISQLSNPDARDPVTATPVCYAAGTLIRTTRGDVPVETLHVGDLAITAAGVARPIVWIGHGEVDCRNHVNLRSVLPIRIAANAFGSGLPEHDLFVSPGHSLCVTIIDEVLIQAGDLVNGATIARVEVESVDYWHVELENHDVLLANGLPAESYLDADNRGFFSQGHGAPDATGGSDWLSRFCRPPVKEGPVLEAVRAQLAKRAENLGWRRDSDAGVSLVVDGAEIPMQRLGDTLVFLIPASAQAARLLSKTHCPVDALGEGDSRRLGVKIKSLSIGDGKEWRRVPLDDACLGQGFHSTESDGGVSWRWTDGDAALPRALWAGLSTDVVAIHISYESANRRGWISPVEASDRTNSPAAAPKLYAVA